VETGRRAALGIVVALAACGHKSEHGGVPKAGAILTALFHASEDAKQPWRCSALDVPALPDEDLGHGWTTHDHTLARGDEGLVVGVIADAGGSAPNTLAALGRLRAQFDAAKPDLVIALGGNGRDDKELVATLGALGDRAPWPIVSLPGDLESETAHRQALATLRKRGDVVLDGRQVRFIESGGVTIGTIPGAGARERLVAGGDGCGWTAADIATLYGAITAKSGVRIIASAEAPRRMTGGEPTGELALVPPQPIEVLIHGPVTPAPSVAVSGSRDGAKAVLTPGTADATTRLPGPHTPSAGILSVRGQTWTWKPLVDSRPQR
jgi:hypothetical protein